MASLTDELHIARSRALETYSAVEHALCMLFAALLETNPTLAAHVFYRLGQSARNRMLEALLKQKFKAQYDNYWYGTSDNKTTGLMRMIKHLDDRRHQMAHWTVSAFSYPADHKEKSGVYMVKPEFWALPDDPHKVSAADMREFFDRGGFVSYNVIQFTGIVAKSQYVGANKDALDTWLAIFAQPILYPPPQGHPLAPKQ